MNNKERGKKNLKKGNNYEYRNVNRALKFGLKAKRVNRSGAGEDKGDVIIERRRHECKYHDSSDGFKGLYDLVIKAFNQGCKGVIMGVKEKGKPHIVILERDDYLNLLSTIKKTRNKNSGGNSIEDDKEFYMKHKQLFCEDCLYSNTCDITLDECEYWREFQE